MKLCLFLILFITLIPLSSAALVQDILDDTGSLQEIITLNSSIKTINLPIGVQNVHVKGSNYYLNGTNLFLDSCISGCEISFKLSDILQKESKNKMSFSRNIDAFENSTYEIHLPIGSIIDLSGENIVPQANQITSDGKSVIVIWDVKANDLQRYYVSFTNHEETESTFKEFTGELNELSVMLFSLVLLIIGFLSGYFLRKDKHVSVVLEQLLSPDEKVLLEEINKHYSSSDKSITQKDLGKKLNWSKSKISGIMTLLVQKKLVEKEKVGRNYTVKTLTKIVKE